MSELEALILGVLQGATEFLPVSSSGHLVMGQELLGLSVPGIAFEVVLHVATLLSVFVVYRGRILELGTGALVKNDRGAWRYLGLSRSRDPPCRDRGAGVQGPSGGALRGAGGRRGRAPRNRRSPLLDPMGAAASRGRRCRRRCRAPHRDRPERGFGSRHLEVGLDGRHGALARGPPRGGGCVFLPPLHSGDRGAALLQAPDLAASATGIGTAPLAIGFAFAALTGVLAIRLFVRMLENRSFPAFSWYCWGAGILFLGWLALAGG